MFYCDPCREEHGLREGFARSLGTCEYCGRRANCQDVPSSILAEDARRKRPPMTLDQFRGALAAHLRNSQLDMLTLTAIALEDGLDPEIVTMIFFSEGKKAEKKDDPDKEFSEAERVDRRKEWRERLRLREAPT